VHNIFEILSLDSCSTWRLFIDSSKSSLKAVLLHNSSILAYIPLALSEQYEALKLVLEKIKYHEHPENMPPVCLEDWKVLHRTQNVRLYLHFFSKYSSYVFSELPIKACVS
jgi:hypothetical protein